MPFVGAGRGRVTYLGATFYVVDCGGGGNCLFLSFAWLLGHHGVGGGPYDHAALRAEASTALVDWVDGNAGMPVDWLHEGVVSNVLDHQLVRADAVKLATARVYGELGAVAALVAWLSANGRHVEVHVLDSTNGEVDVFAPQGNAPAHTILLYYTPYHYQALVPEADRDRVELARLPAAYRDGIPPTVRRGGTPTASVQSSSQPSKTTTLASSVETVVEIHHIDVGQGDSTLIQIKDAHDAIHFAILIDAGEKAGQVTPYLDGLIEEGRFRPIDMLFVTHPDKDHIGDIKNVLGARDPKTGKPLYVSGQAALYDNGQPPQIDREYTDNYLNGPLADRRRRPPLKGKLLDFMGVKLRCLACNGVVRGEGEAPYRQHLGRLIDESFNVTYDALDLKEDTEYRPDDERQLARESDYPGDKNNYSIALHLSFEEFSYFTAGDLEDSYEEHVAWIVNSTWGPVSAWKAGHHGAETSNKEGAVGFLQGRFCALSYGTNSGHGHPHQATIDHLESLALDGKVPCTYYGTGTAPGAAGKKKTGTLGPNGKDGKGTIVIRARGSVVGSKEEFEVRTEADGSGWTTFTCARDDHRKKGHWAPVTPSASLGVSLNKKSDQQKQDSADRKRKRRDELADTIRGEMESEILRLHRGLDEYRKAVNASADNQKLEAEFVDYIIALRLEAWALPGRIKKDLPDLLRSLGL